MSLLDIFRQEYVTGKVVDKYRLNNGNIGLIIDHDGTKKHYHVEFKDCHKGPDIENLYGLLNDPFSGKTDCVDRLINKGDFVELSVNFSKSSFREAYRIHSVSGSALNKMLKESPNLPYNSLKMPRY